MCEEQTIIDLSQWYNATDAAERLSRNSKKTISISYPRKLAQYNKVRTYKISERNILYYKPDIDVYIVEDRGEKLGRAKRQNAAPKAKKTKRAA